MEAESTTFSVDVTVENEFRAPLREDEHGDGDHIAVVLVPLSLVQQVCAAERLTRFHLETHN